MNNLYPKGHTLAGHENLQAGEKVMRNKKGEKYLSVYWFAILAIVAVGIVAMVLVFYGKPYDVREIEANVMINKIADCLSDSEGNLRVEINNENVLQECGFVLSDDFYFEVGEIKQGNSNLKDSCGKGESVVCVDKNLYLLDVGEIIILSVVREHENK